MAEIKAAGNKVLTRILYVTVEYQHTRPLQIKAHIEMQLGNTLGFFLFYWEIRQLYSFLFLF